MRINFLFFLAAAFLISFSSCKEELTAPDSSQRLVGSWVLKGYDNEDPNITVLQRSAGLDSSSGGFIFYNDGRLLERKNAGWCGTPPISYANFPGTWVMDSDSLIKINAGYWGGMTDYALKIISLDLFQLKVIYLYPL
jgi:hypothetical protein